MGCFQETGGREFSSAHSPLALLPALYPPLSLECYAKSALSSHLPLTHQMHARQPLCQTEFKKKKENNNRRRRKVAECNHLAADAAPHICPCSFLISSFALKQTEKAPSLRFGESGCVLIQCNPIHCKRPITRKKERPNPFEAVVALLEP